MARRYYKKRTVVVRPKKKWATNFTTLGEPTTKTLNLTPGQVNTLTFNNILVQNTAQTASPTPVIVKTGNFKVKGDMKLSFIQASGTQSSSMTSCVIYIMYIPEGITASATLISAHPEWIMAWSPVDINMDVVSSTMNIQNVNKFSFSSRLKRNLNSGDRIECLTVFNFGPSPTAGNVSIDVTVSPAILCQYWTCSN